MGTYFYILHDYGIRPSTTFAMGLRMVTSPMPPMSTTPPPSTTETPTTCLTPTRLRLTGTVTSTTVSISAFSTSTVPPTPGPSADGTKVKVLTSTRTLSSPELRSATLLKPSDSPKVVTSSPSCASSGPI